MHQEECVPLFLPTHTQGRKRCTYTLPVGVEGPGFGSHSGTSTLTETLTIHSRANTEILIFSWHDVLTCLESVLLSNLWMTYWVAVLILTYVPQSRWMRVSLFPRGDCDQIRWFLYWPDRIHWSAWFLKGTECIIGSAVKSSWHRMSTVAPCLCFKRILDMYLISWLDSESRAGFCGLCRSSAPGPAVIAQRRSTSPLTWNTVESGF